MFWNLLFRWTFPGMFIRLLFPVHIEGLENLPKSGPYIIAAGPHRTEFESLILASNFPKLWLRFFAKAEYWDRRLLGALMTAIGLLPIPRDGKKALVQQVKLGVDVLEAGGILAIYPEATRGYDDLVHKGYPGVARISLKAGGVPIVPVGLLGMRKLNPSGHKLRLGKATIVVGEPIVPSSFLTKDEETVVGAALQTLLTPRLTARISEAIADLTPYKYSDTLLPIPGVQK